MLTVKDYDNARRILASRDEFGPPSMFEYISRLEEAAQVDFSALKKYVSSFLPFMHGAEHINIRRLINRRFSRAEVKKWHTIIVEIIERRLSVLKANTDYDLIIDIIDPLYMDFVESLFGIALPDRKQFIQHIEVATNAVERMSSISQLRQLQRTLIALEALVATQLNDNSHDSTFQNSLFKDIAASVQGELNADELMSVLLVLLIAPRATTETLAHIMVAFSQLDDQQRAAYSAPAWVEQHINDLIRLYASTNVLSKEAKQHLEINGCPITSGSQVLIDIPCVNRDPKIYQTQTTLGALSGNANERKHLTFGAGAHICIGAELAKDIISAFIPRWFRQFPNITCDPHSATYYNAHIATRIKTLRVQFG